NIGYLNDENYDTVFNSIPTWLSNLEEDKIKFQEKYRMFTKDVLGNEIYEFIGKLGIQCQKRGLKSQFANMLSLLDNTQSMYYVPNGVKQGLYTRWDLIQQLTDNLKRMDFVNRASNSSQIFSLVESL
ncbi:MAG TPA: hypothetical protein PJ990_16885, partial [Saprospiraceae bacterium]|nr:hypothetical protein [Saprospiraceae bacterium]